MADSTQIVAFHRERGLLAGFGAVAFLLGVNSTFASYSKQGKHAHVVKPFLYREKPWQKAALIVAGCLLISGLTLMFLSVLLYDDQKEKLPTDIASLAQHIQKQKVNQSKVPETAIVHGISAAVILTGFGLLMWNYHTTERFQLLSVLLYAVGWFTAAVTMSTDARGLSTIQPKRLLWTLPGALLTVAGTVAIPWELEQPALMGPSIATLAVGLTSMTIGHTLVT
jgi:hypothetical protein